MPFKKKIYPEGTTFTKCQACGYKKTMAEMVIICNRVKEDKPLQVCTECSALDEAEYGPAKVWEGFTI